MGGTPTAALNECLEEAVAFCQAMTLAAQEAEAAARHLGEQGRAIQRAVADHAAGRRQAYSEAAQAADLATQDAASPAASAIEDLTTAGEDAKSAVLRLLGGVRDHASRLGSLRGRIGERLEVELERSDVARELLAEAVDGYRGAIEAALVDAADGLTRLRERRDAVVDALDEGRERTKGALDAVARDALTAASTTAEGVTETLHVLGREAATLANGAIRLHNDAVVALRTTFTGEADPASPGPADEWSDPSFEAVLPVAAQAASALDEARWRVSGLPAAAGAQYAELRDALVRASVETSERAAAILPRHLP
jgi:hypothetical protein